MCELMTIAAAVVFTALHFAAKRRGKASRSLFTVMLTFWGAALMWSVDCVANAMEGESLLDISVADAVLGCIVITAGMVLFAVLALAERIRSKTHSVAR